MQRLLRDRLSLGAGDVSGRLTVRVGGWAKVTWSGMTTILQAVIAESIADAVQAIPTSPQDVGRLHHAIQAEVAGRIGLDPAYVRAVVVESMDEHTAVATWACRAELSVVEMNKLIASNGLSPRIRSGFAPRRGRPRGWSRLEWVAA